jgi:hypothetical protein
MLLFKLRDHCVQNKERILVRSYISLSVYLRILTKKSRAIFEWNVQEEGYTIQKLQD